MLLPDSMEVRVCVPFNSRSTAWVSFDGRGRVELKRAFLVSPLQAPKLTLATEGDHIKVTASKYPFPTVCADKQSTDWFHAISRTLKWNERERQKSFVVVEESPAKEERNSDRHKNDADEDELSDEDGSEEEEEEEKFDIDDLSSDSDAAPPARDSVDSGLGSSPSTSPSSASASQAAEAIMGVSRAAHAKARARSRSRSGIRSGVDSPSRFGAAPPRSSPGHHGHGHVHWATSVPDNANNVPSPIDGSGMNDMATPTAANGRRMRSRSPAPVHSHQHPRAFAVWGQDESDSNSSDNDP